MVRQTELQSTGAHLIFKELFERLDQSKLHVLRKSAHIVVRFHHLRGLGTALDDVRVDGPLSQEIDSLQLARLLFKYADKFAADHFTLLLRIGYSFQLPEEAVGGVHIDKICLQLIPEDPNYILRLPFTHQTVIDMDTDELIPHRLQKQRRNHRGIHTAGEREQYLLIADLLTYQFNLICDKVLHIPVGLSAADVKYKRL